MLTLFDDITEDVESNKKLGPIDAELFLRRRKVNIALAFISQSYFKVPKTIRLNATHYFIMKTPNKRQLQEIASNHSSDIGFKYLMKLYRDYTKEPFLFLLNDTTLSSGNPLTFMKNVL